MLLFKQQGGHYMCEENITHKCIYCGATEDLSESDIVPDALTNARILNGNVCKIAHNNKFSDMFESKVIEALSFITNILDIKTSKSSKYPQYEAFAIIDGKEYKARIRDEREWFNGQIRVSTDKTQKFGAYDKIEKMAKGDEIATVDVNDRKFDSRVTIPAEIFFDEAYYRMLSKIAFEWYCKENNVIGYHSEFDNIIKYITEGVGTRPVTIIQDEIVYELRSQIQNLGSHMLFGFEAIDGKINVVISLFGLLMYRVVVSDVVPSFCNNNFLFAELRIDSKKTEHKHADYEASKTYFANIFDPKNFRPINIGGITIMLPLSMSPVDVSVYPIIMDIVKILAETNNDMSTPDKKVQDMLFKFTEELTQASVLHKRAIRRFVNVYFSDHHAPIIISPESCDRKKAFLFYVVYLIGKSDIAELNDKALQDIINKRFELSYDATINLTEELSNTLVQEILADEEYSSVLEDGATKIKAWNN